MRDLESARLEKVTEEHNVIDDAIADRGEGYTVFSIVRLSELVPSPYSNVCSACWYSVQAV